MATQYDAKYEDPVERTHRLYGKEIERAKRHLLIDSIANRTGAPKYESFNDIKILETKVQELTKDPNARLMSNLDDYKMLLSMKLATAAIMKDVKQQMRARSVN